MKSQELKSVAFKLSGLKCYCHESVMFTVTCFIKMKNRKYRVPVPSINYSWLYQHQFRFVFNSLSSLVHIYFFRLSFALSSVKNKINICFASGAMRLQLRLTLIFLGSITSLRNRTLILTQKLIFC